MGTEILFRLVSTKREKVTYKMDFRYGTTPVRLEEFELSKSILPQANLSGTVEYVGLPQYKYEVGTMDPDATITNMRTSKKLSDGRYWSRYRVLIPMPDRPPYREFFYRFE